MRKIPTVDETLIEALNERVPERCPDPSWSEREIWIYAGKRELVKLLINEFTLQKDNLVKEL